jgi:hypothetical protein
MASIINQLFLAGVTITADPATGVAQTVDLGGATLSNARDLVTQENVEHVVDRQLTNTTLNIADLQLQIAQLQFLVAQSLNPHNHLNIANAQGNYDAILNAPRSHALPYLIESIAVA